MDGSYQANLGRGDEYPGKMLFFSFNYGSLTCSYSRFDPVITVTFEH